MNFLIKNKKLLIIVASAVVAVSLAGFIFITFRGYKVKINDKERQIVTLQQTIESIGELTTAYVVRADVVAGKIIEETDLQAVDIPVSMAQTLVTNLNDTKDKYYKIGLKQGSTLTNDMILANKLENSSRLLDVITDENPLGVTPGKYVDIRISMSLGEDFIAMTHKRIAEINSGILKLEVNEADIHIYNSMLVDKIMYPGTRIYAVEYIEPGVQIEASAYYPVTKNILAVIGTDPNLSEGLRGDMLARRNQLEASLSVVADQEIARLMERGKSKITGAIEAGDKVIQKEWAVKAKDAAKTKPATTKSNTTNTTTKTEGGGSK